MCEDYQPPVDSEPEEEIVPEAAPPPKPEGGDDDGEGAEDAGTELDWNEND